MSTNKAVPVQPVGGETHSLPDAVSPNPSVRWWTGRTKGPTFSSAKVRWWVELFLQDAENILNPCAGPTRLDVDGDVLRVDVSEDNGDADLYIDFRELLEGGYVKPASYDAIVYDPPYSAHQARKKYGIDIEDDEFYFYSEAVMELFDTLLAPGGLFIQFGYTTETMPASAGYDRLAISVFNKCGCQNDYLGVVDRKPTGTPQPTGALTLRDSILPNQGSENIDNDQITVDGNGGEVVDAVYHRSEAGSNFCNELSTVAGNWINPGDRVLHIYENEPRINVQTDEWTTCAYRSPDLNTGKEDVYADVIETPWNIGARFGTGVFDVVILDLPYTAWQTNIRTPHAQASEGSDFTHTDTAIKRSITDLVNGDGGRVVQVGRTATLMSSHEYHYVRQGIGVIRHPEQDQDRIVVVDEKRHENLEVAGLGDGEVDGEYQNPNGAPGITSKNNRTNHLPSLNSNFCVHCGNSYYHHPAGYVDCPDCNAHRNSLCQSADGVIRHPTGPDHSLVARDVCDGRLEKAREWHNGRCNNKNKSYIKAPESAVELAVEAIESGGYLDLERALINGIVRKCLCDEPRATTLPEQVVAKIYSDESAAEAESDEESKKRPTASETTLFDF